MGGVELLPCPFCGGEAELTLKGNVHSTRKCVVKCVECRYQRTDAALRYGDDWLRATAIAAWNRRATATQAAEIEALRAEASTAHDAVLYHIAEHAKTRARAERLAEALIAWHKQATEKGRREREESPGHSHAVLGVWDSDNGKYAGVECAQCALWFEATRLRAAQENDDA